MDTFAIPAGTLMKRQSAPTEEYVVIVNGIRAGDAHATVRYFGGQGYTWTERTENLLQPAFNAVAF